MEYFDIRDIVNLTAAWEDWPRTVWMIAGGRKRNNSIAKAYLNFSRYGEKRKAIAYV